MTAMRVKDGMQVMLERIPARGGPQELEITRLLSSPDHYVPLLEILDLPGNPDQRLKVTPFLSPDKTKFRTFGEFVAFFTQICEVSSADFLIRGIS